MSSEETRTCTGAERPAPAFTTITYTTSTKTKYNTNSATRQHTTRDVTTTSSRGEMCHDATGANCPAAAPHRSAAKWRRKEKRNSTVHASRKWLRHTITSARESRGTGTWEQTKEVQQYVAHVRGVTAANTATREARRTRVFGAKRVGRGVIRRYAEQSAHVDLYLQRALVRDSHTSSILPSNIVLPC